VAEFALKDIFAGRAEDEEVVAIVENDSCAVDAVQALTGCTFGKGNLIFRDYGKQVYTFIKRPSGEALRISVNPASPPGTPAEKTLWERYMKGERSAEILKAVHSRKAKKIKAVMGAKETELFKVERLKINPPCEARVFRSLVCEKCGEKTMETRVRMIAGRALCIPCFEKELSRCRKR
jgi:formylmethanofuran dehydrogenase subunit E